MKSTVAILLWLWSAASIALGALLYAILSMHPNGAVIWLIPLGFLIVGLAINPFVAVNLLGGKRRKAALAVAACLLSLGGALFLASGLGQYYFALRDTPDYATAIPLLTIGAYAGSSVDAHNLGVAYQKGLGVARDPAAAASWFTKAAERGFKEAQLALGHMLAVGEHQSADFPAAIKWLRLAADQNSVPAMTLLGRVFTESGSHQSLPVARTWFESAANRGDVEALLALGDLQSKGMGGPQDQPEARRSYERAAELGSVDGAYNLGVMHEYGRGGEVNFQAAARYYEVSANAGQTEGQINLAVLLINGKGVERDLAKAKALLTSAANSNNKEMVELANENLRVIESMYQ